MKQSVLVPLFVALVLAAATAAYAQRSPGEGVDDTTIAVAVKSALFNSDAVEAGKINVEVYKRTVQLSGYVPTEAEKSAALEIAAAVENVADVDDAIIVMAGRRSVGRTIDDETINGKIKLRIADVSGIGEAIGIVTHVRNGEVLLAGFTDDEQVHDAVVAAAKSVDGVLKVHDRIAIKP